MLKELDKTFQNSKRVSINDNTKLVIMSDCHRGAGDIFDNFVSNKEIFKDALNYYYKNNFTYIELGDGDDMWEVKNYKDIINSHLDVFMQLKEFHNSNRLIMIYGNHDLEKKIPSVLAETFYKYRDENTKQDINLLYGLTAFESLVLNYKDHDIFLLHGHQVDFLNSKLWRLSRFLVKYVWRFLERIGIKEPTKDSYNNNVTNRTEKKLQKWSIRTNKILISGHTHRAIFPKIGRGLYFNDGSCIYPSGITCLEIERGTISLVKWVKANTTIKRVLLEENKLINFFDKTSK